MEKIHPMIKIYITAHIKLVIKNIGSSPKKLVKKQKKNKKFLSRLTTEGRKSRIAKR